MKWDLIIVSSASGGRVQPMRRGFLEEQNTKYLVPDTDYIEIGKFRIRAKDYRNNFMLYSDFLQKQLEQ